MSSYLENKMIDLSIKNLFKVLDNQDKIKDFLNQDIEIEEKLDGIKVTLIHRSNTNNYKKDWIVAYKGTIIYPEEIKFSLEQIKKESIGESQFLYIFNKLKNSDYSSLPINTEYFVEFLVKKDTLMSSYDNLNAVLLASSKTDFEINNGKLISNPLESFNNNNIETTAKILNIDTPYCLFKGKLIDLPNSDSIDKEFKRRLVKIELSNDPKTFLNQISDTLLSLMSRYGGCPEGYVFKTKDSFYKIQQSYQLDKTKRKEKKDKYLLSPELESDYRTEINRLAKQIALKLSPLTIETEKKIDILSRKIVDLKLKIKNEKKTDLQIKEDLIRQTKRYMFINTKNNKNFLFLGKMRVLSTAHYSIIKNQLKNYDHGIVCLVSSKNTKNSEDLRLKMLKKAFGDKIIIITHSSGNINTILRKCPLDITALYCGSDRVSDYKRQLEYSIIEVKEIERDIDNEDGVSATNIIKNINNKNYFINNTPKEIHSMYDEIMNFYRTLEP